MGHQHCVEGKLTCLGTQGIRAGQWEKNTSESIVMDVICSVKLTASKDQSKVFGRAGR